MSDQDSPAVSATNGALLTREITTYEEVTECDTEKVHLVGHVQGEAGNALFFTFPEGKIVGADMKICSVPWIQSTDTGNNSTDDRPSKRMRRNSTDNGGSSSPCSVPSLTGSTTESRVHGVLGSPLSSWIPSNLNDEIKFLVRDMINSASKRSFHFYSHSTGRYAISLAPTQDDYSIIGLEIERLDDCEPSGEFSQTLVSLSRIMQSHSDDQIVKTACDTVFDLLGKFDRGMVYRFNDDLSGEVVHEIKAEHVDSSYLGMRFPAGDIPLPARQLFLKNGLRYIQNVNAEDTPIIHQVSESEMDLSQIRMRAVSIHHIRYLQNMGVVSSMSIAVVVDNELWGLLSFHGYREAFKPSLQQRIAIETVATMLSVRMEALEKKTQSTRIIDLSQVLMNWEQDHSVIKNIEELGKQMLGVVDADVVVGRVRDPAKDEAEIVVVGDASLVPSEKFWFEFSKNSKREVISFNTRASIAKLGLSEQDCKAGGVTYYRDGLIEIMFGRGLRSRDVVWGGNPDAPKVRKDGFLCPRNSFDQFMEKAHKEARAWSKSDLHLITTLADRVSEHSHNRMVSLLKHDIEEANHKYFNAIERARDNCDFFAQMSHEIRTPFHGVMGCLNLLSDARNMAPDDIQDMVNTALNSGNHMIGLLNDILDISKNEYGHSVAMERVDFETLGSEAIDGMKSLALSNGIKFQHQFSIPKPEDAVIMTDKTKVVQIVSNVINNAIKFSPNGDINVRIELPNTLQAAVSRWEEDSKMHKGSIFAMQEHPIFTSVDAVKAHVANSQLPGNQKLMLITVADSGCGIEHKDLAEMLKPYTQSSNGSNRTFQGTGLGLFICLSLCQQLNGFIACSSTPGVGSTFHVGIPVGIASREASPASEGNSLNSVISREPLNCALPEAEIGSVIRFRGPIAVVDDNKVNVKILVRALTVECKKAGIEADIVTADGGMAAYELYKKYQPDVIFIDYHMPDVDGLQATEMIREYEMVNNLKSAFIMSYTADATEKTAKLLLSRGTNEIMTKPSPKGFLKDFVSRLDEENLQGSLNSAA